MQPTTFKRLALTSLLLLCFIGNSFTPSSQAQKTSATFSPTIPKTWDDAAMAELELPLANPAYSAKHVSAEYYYRIPAQPIYKSYPIYAPGKEPPGYVDKLKQGIENLWRERHDLTCGPQLAFGRIEQELTEAEETFCVSVGVHRRIPKKIPRKSQRSFRTCLPLAGYRRLKLGDSNDSHFCNALKTRPL
ncbi:MAG TPA: hypothetical protein VFZ34_24490 [Blastocatellia bacterium]|nr:hypothetical protein [Blastocatellia bacterium]